MKNCFGTFLIVLSNLVLLTGQQLDTTLLLPDVEVRAAVPNAEVLGQFVDRPDSLALIAPLLQTVDQVLNAAGLLYIKDYGPGQLSSPAQGGGSAAQTSIVWNGIPIQSPLLGQLDLSVLRASDQLFLTGPGGGPALGSGDLAGTLHLASPLPVGNNLTVRLAGNGGSFSRYGAGANVKVARPTWANNTRFFFQDQANNFPFTDLRGREQRQSHAHFQQVHLLQENAWMINRNNRIEVRGWFQSADREIPPLLGQRESEAKQKDDAFRSMIAWFGTIGNWNFKAKTAYLREQIEYKDILSLIDSKSNSWNSWTEATASHPIGRRNTLEFGARVSLLGAASTNFEEDPSETRPAVFVSWRYQSLMDRLRIQFQLRQEWRNGQRAPLSPYTGLEWQITKGLFFKASGTYAYRLPTFNDLYWSPGGNPDLEAEQGWAVNGGLRWIRRWDQFVLTARGNGFSRWVDDWIIWLPDRGLIWTPENIRKVWSRGVNLGLSGGLVWSGDWQLLATGSYEWVRSTNQETQQRRQGSIGRQLIYVPIHRGRLGGMLRWKGASLGYAQLWIGEVFVLADNSLSLPALSVGELTLSYKWKAGNFGGKAFMLINNIWNAEYQVVAGRPMPLQSFQFGLQFNFQKHFK